MQAHGAGPFEFRKAAFLVEVTPYRAASLQDLLTGVTLAPEWSIFFHLHRHFFRNPERLPEYPNDFATWARESLGDAVVAERLANLNLLRSVGLAVVRREITVILAERLRDEGAARQALSGPEFIFCQPRLVVFASGLRARTPAEFPDRLRAADADTIGYHLFAPKASPAPAANDFAAWFRAWGYGSLADQLDAFDAYLNSLEDNRTYLIELIETGLHVMVPGGAT
jgi:hypothetical protein